MYATPWHVTDGSAGGELPDYLQLWRFDRYYRLSADQLPRVLCREALDTAALSFRRWRLGGRLTGARMWLFCLPSGQIVAALSVDADCGLGETIDLLEDCYFADVQIGSETAEARAYAMAAQRGAAGGGSGRAFLPERHQLIFDHAPAPDDYDDLIQRLIYRTDLPYRKEYSSIRHAAYQDVRRFRQFEQADGTTQARRRTLERIADQLGDLELELSYSVEAAGDLGLLVPSLRVESFHNGLYESMDLAAKARTVGRMRQRLGRAISAELTAIESIGRRADDGRRIRYAVAVGFVSTVAIPAGLILAFLGINARQVNPGRSMFDHHYAGMYLTVAAVIALGAVVSLAVYARQRRNAQTPQPHAERRRWNLAPDETPP